MSNGDSLDGFVFPPFIPPAAARPVPPAAPATPAPVAQHSAAEPQSSAPGRMTMPWDAQTPIVRGADAPAAVEPAVDEEEEDLPWLERPAPREPVAQAPAAPAADAAPAQDDAFPDWLAWDDRNTDEARPEVADVAPVDGLEDFIPGDDASGFIAAPPAVQWAEAAPDPARADAADSTAWSLDAPEAVQPPAAAAPAPELTFESPQAAAEAEPAFEVTLDGGTLTFAPADAAAEVEAEVIAPEPVAAAMDPFVADEEAVIASEPDPFTAASVHEAETNAPVEAAAPAPAMAGASANGAFTEVAARLEDIARTLRERPDDLLSGAAQDPLALLVTGYVMGYGARR